MKGRNPAGAHSRCSTPPRHTRVCWTPSEGARRGHPAVPRQVCKPHARAARQGGGSRPPSSRSRASCPACGRLGRRRSRCAGRSSGTPAAACTSIAVRIDDGRCSVRWAGVPARAACRLPPRCLTGPPSIPRARHSPGTRSPNPGSLGGSGRRRMGRRLRPPTADWPPAGGTGLWPAAQGPERKPGQRH